MTTLLDRLGSNFLTAAFIPALWFVVLVELLFSSLDLAGSATWLALPVTLEGSLITLVFTLVIGFTLMSLNTFLYKLLEGYYVLERFTGLRRRHAMKLRKRKFEFALRDRYADYLIGPYKEEQEPAAKARRYDQINQLRQSSRDLKASFKQDYPSRAEAVLPTRFGNILKSSEQYAGENYSIDSVVMWPRLIHVIDPEYYRKLDESNNNLAFIINCMALAVILMFLSLGAAGYQRYQNNGWIGSATTPPIQHQTSASAGEKDEAVSESSALPSNEGVERGRSALFYLGSAFLFAGIAWIFYNVSLPAARQYGNLFRSAFDLFRFDLLTQLRLPLPANEGEETIMWEQLSEFLALGALEVERPEPFVYEHPLTKSPLKKGKKKLKGRSQKGR